MFMFGENLSLVDALYLTVVSASTVGYGNYLLLGSFSILCVGRFVSWYMFTFQ